MTRAGRPLLVVLLLGAALAILSLAGVLPRPAFLGGDAVETARDGGESPEAMELDVDEEAEDGFQLSAHPRAARPGAAPAAGTDAAAAGAAAPKAPGGILGTVLRADGRPATNARVTALGVDGAPVTVVADGEGRFALDVPAGRYDLLVRAGFDGGLWLRDVLADGRALSTPLRLGPAADLRVEVVQDGRPVAQATVRARLQQDAGAVQTVAEGATDGAGVFLAEAIPYGAYVLEVGTGGAVLTRRLAVSGNATVPFSIPAPVRLLGQVTEAVTRLPLAAQIEVTVGTSEGLSVHVVGQAGADGVYSLEVPRGRPQAFLASTADHAPFPSPTEVGGVMSSLQGLRGEEPVRRDVELRPGAVVRGLVVHATTKQPVPDLSIRFVQDRLPAVRTVTTAADGTYEARGLGAGTWRGLIETPGWYGKDGEAATVRVPPPGAEGLGAEVRLDWTVWSAGQVSGQVVLADGSPVVGARVWIVGGSGVVRGARRAGRALEAFSGADGTFLVDDVPQDVSVRVRATLGDAEAVPSNPIRLLDGVTAPVRLTLAPAVHVTGRVLDLATHGPVSGARVQIDPVGEPGGRGGKSVLTAADGRFDAANLIPGAWRFTPTLRRVYLPGEPKEVDVGAEPRELDVALTLDPGLAVAGVVVDAEGRAVVGARVTLFGSEDVGTPPPSQWRNATTDARGAFRFTALRPGRYSVIARRKGFLDARLDGLRGGEDRLRIAMAPPPATGN